MNKKVLITGVAGLLGARLADWIIENKPEYEVVGVDNLDGGYLDNVHPRCNFYKSDCTDTIEMDKIFSTHKFEYVFHFAAYAAEGLSPFIRCFNYTNNLLATANIVNNCIRHDIKRLVFTSTMAVYGHGNPPFDESHQPAPIDPYGVAKFACEQDIQIAGEQHGLDWCIIRPHNVYGIKQNIWDKYRNVLGIWMYQHLNGKPMTIYGDGTQTRAFSYIDDCLEPLWKAAVDEKTSKEIINLGGTKYHSIKEANEILIEVIGDGEFIHMEPRHEVKDAHPTWKKSVELLNYNDTTSLNDGLTEMWEWAKQQPMREQFIWENYELDKGIYSFWRK
jgi:UDP-glucose 4-epimerase